MLRNINYLVFVAGILLFSVNLGLAESDRPELLTRTFDRNYIVKYLGHITTQFMMEFKVRKHQQNEH